MSTSEQAMEPTSSSYSHADTRMCSGVKSVRLQHLPPDVLIAILRLVPSESRARAVATCIALSRASEKIQPETVVVPERALQLTNSEDEYQYWGSFITWAMKYRRSLKFATVNLTFVAPAQIDSFFRWVTQLVGMCPLLNTDRSIQLRIKLSGGTKPSLLQPLLNSVKRASQCALLSLSSDSNSWVMRSSSNVTLPDLLSLSDLQSLACGIGRQSTLLTHSQAVGLPPLQDVSLYLKISHLNEPLSGTLAYCSTLRSLSFHFLDDDDSDWNAALYFAAMLTSLTRLSALTITKVSPTTRVNFGAQLCASLAIVLPRLTSLRDLDLQIPCSPALLKNITQASALTLIRLFVVLESNPCQLCTDQLGLISSCPNIRHLTLQVPLSLPIHDVSIVPTALRHIRSLTLRVASYLSASQDWLTSLKDLTQLTSLKVFVEDGYESDEDEDDDLVDQAVHGCTGPLCEVFRSLTGLRHLALSCTGETSESARWAVAAISRLTLLTHLSLASWCGQPDDAFWDLELKSSLPLLTHLRSLKLQAMPELNEAAGIEILAPAVAMLTNLTRLDLQGTSIPEAGQKAVSDALARNTGVIQQELPVCGKGVPITP